MCPQRISFLLSYVYFALKARAPVHYIYHYNLKTIRIQISPMGYNVWKRALCTREGDVRMDPSSQVILLRNPSYGRLIEITPF